MEFLFLPFIFGESLACHYPQVVLDAFVQNVSQGGFLFQLLAKVGVYEMEREICTETEQLSSLVAYF